MENQTSYKLAYEFENDMENCPPVSSPVARRPHMKYLSFYSSMCDKVLCALWVMWDMCCGPVGNMYIVIHLSAVDNHKHNRTLINYCLCILNILLSNSNNVNCFSSVVAVELN